MGFFDLFRSERKQENNCLRGHVIDDINFKGHLYLAAEARKQAEEAIKKGDFDLAWRKYHEQKGHFAQHASQLGYSKQEFIALDASVHEGLANILRLEGKHKSALINIVYWIMAGRNRPIKSHDSKLRAYFNRCKIKKTSLDEFKQKLVQVDKQPQYLLAELLVDDLFQSED